MKTIKDIDLANKKVIVRVDYNVPIKNGEITSTKKIDDTFETLDYLVSQGSKVILLSHFGRIKEESDKESNSLKPVYEYIKGLNKYNILFSNTPMGEELDNIIKTLMPGQIVLAENTRYLDLDNKMESSCDVQLSEYWASLADIYIDDAFGSMHRNHASITGIPKYIESGIGFLVEKELEGLNKIVFTPTRPFVVVMGGAKLEDKINLIYTLAEKADYILIGGGIANTFLNAKGYNIGSSLVSKDSLTKAMQIAQEFPDKLVLPKDVITSPTYSESIYEHKMIDDVEEDDVIGDIGSAAVENYRTIINKANTIFVNGTVGMYEKLEFSNGTREILDAVANSPAYKIVGGGDAGSALKKFNFEDKMNFVSTGGGATLEYIANGTLVGLTAIEQSNKSL